MVNFHGSVILPYCIKAKRCMGYWSGLALCLTKVRSSRARCPATALISSVLCLVYKAFDMHVRVPSHP